MRLSALLLTCLSFLGAAQAAEPSKLKGLSFVILAEPVLPSPIKVRAALQERLGTGANIDDMETDDKKVILFRIGGGTVAIGLLDLPIPNKELDQVCRSAWYWRAACESVAPHKAHLIVSILDTDLDKLGAALLLTNAVAALMDSNAIASYWGTSLQSRDAFLKQSANASRDTLPVLLWVSIRMSREGDKRWNISTHGMRAFDLYEIESKDSETDGSSLFTLVAGMVQYLIQKGPVIKDEETIGDSPDLNIRVRHAPSHWREGETVYRVVFPQR